MATKMSSSRGPPTGDKFEEPLAKLSSSRGRWASDKFEEPLSNLGGTSESPSLLTIAPSKSEGEARSKPSTSSKSFGLEISWWGGDSSKSTTEGSSFLVLPHPWSTLGLDTSKTTLESSELRTSTSGCLEPALFLPRGDRLAIPICPTLSIQFISSLEVKEEESLQPPPSKRSLNSRRSGRSSPRAWEEATSWHTSFPDLGSLANWYWKGNCPSTHERRKESELSKGSLHGPSLDTSSLLRSSTKGLPATGGPEDKAPKEVSGADSKKHRSTTQIPHSQKPTLPLQNPDQEGYELAERVDHPCLAQEDDDPKLRGVGKIWTEAQGGPQGYLRPRILLPKARETSTLLIDQVKEGGLRVKEEEIPINQGLNS